METCLEYPKLHTIAFSNALLKLCHKARTSDGDTILFNLNKTEFITPFGITLLAGTISECLEQGKKAKYLRPEKPSTKRFLSGIGFNKFFKISGDEHKIESPNVQLRRLYQVDYLLTEQILDVFSASIKMSEGVRGSLKLALNELMTNALDHSDSKKGFYLCAQSYKQAKTIRLCITDFGIGILNALQKAPKFKKLRSDYESIVLATQEGVTSRVQGTAGYGLTHINRFIDVNEGKMYILSGKGKVLWDFSGLKKIRGKKQTMYLPFEGTMINLVINADGEGFYFLESEDGKIF